MLFIGDKDNPAGKTCYSNPTGTVTQSEITRQRYAS